VVRIKKYFILIAFLLFFFSLVSGAYAYTEITDCTTITEPGEYRLVNDISSSSSTCILIQADNVVLDCQWHMITGAEGEGYYGIYVDSRENVEIRNCVLSGWSSGGVYLYSSNGCILENIISYEGGISLYMSDQNTINNVSVANSDNGISLVYSRNNTIANSQIYSNSYAGIILDTSTGNNLLNLTIYNNFNYGIYIQYSSYNVFANLSLSNVYYNIFVSVYSYGNVFSDIIVDGGVRGIAIFGSYNVLKNSIIRNQWWWGCGLYMHLSYAEGNQIYNNIFNNTNNFCYDWYMVINGNQFSLDFAKGTNILGRLFIGGNLWVTPDGNGYSDTCVDADYDGFCDELYCLTYNCFNNIDYHPLAKYVGQNAPTPLPAYREVADCTRIFFPGEYRLTRDIVNTESDVCINIQGDNIILDCQGYTIGNVLYGIRAENVVNITVVNCRFVNMDVAIEFTGVANSSISSIIIDNCHIGIDLYSSSYINVKNVSDSSSFIGIIVVDNSLYDGIYNVSCSNAYTCVYIYDSSYNTVYNVNMLGVNGSGVVVMYSNNINVSLVNGYGKRSGIVLYNTSNSIVAHSMVRDFENGIFLRYSFSNTIANVTVINSRNGILLNSSNYNQISDSTLKNNYCGINISSSANNSIFNNIFMNNNNVCFREPIYPNYWNTTLRKGKNIVGGSYIGGNFWGRPDGKSILDELKYAIKDGIYVHPYDLLGDGTNVDYHPLAMYVSLLPPIGLGATARAIARINPLAVLIFVLMPIIIGEFLIRNFEEIKANEPLKAIMRLLIIIAALALFALAF
jgi:parallel beta-helix repeat protein